MGKLGKRIVKRLAAFADVLEKEEIITQRFTCRRVEIQLEPERYDPEKVKETRKQLGASQAIFAQFLGVSTKSVAAWEQGSKTPSGIACRFMDEIRLNPEYWQNRLIKSAVSKTPA